MKVRLFTSLFLSVISFSAPSAHSAAFAQDPLACGGPSPATDACVRSAIHDLAVAHRQTVGYNSARERLFQFVNAYQGNRGKKQVDCVYSNETLTVTSPGIPSGSFNTEHSWPQSFLKQYPNFESSRADLFHLFPTESHINSIRSNYPFTNCDTPPTGSGRVSKLCGKEFEPPTEHKGVLARAMLYMSVSYNMPIDAAQEQVFRRWNVEHPVTEGELERARRVQEVQGNSNPFIQHPEWVDLLTDF